MKEVIYSPPRYIPLCGAPAFAFSYDVGGSGSGSIFTRRGPPFCFLSAMSCSLTPHPPFGVSDPNSSLPCYFLGVLRRLLFVLPVLPLSLPSSPLFFSAAFSVPLFSCVSCFSLPSRSSSSRSSGFLYLPGPAPSSSPLWTATNFSGITATCLPLLQNTVVRNRELSVPSTYPVL